MAAIRTDTSLKTTQIDENTVTPVTDSFKRIGVSNKHVSSIRASPSKQFDELKRIASRVSLILKPKSKVFQPDEVKRSMLSIDSLAVSMRSKENTNLFKRRASVILPQVSLSAHPSVPIAKSDADHDISDSSSGGFSGASEKSSDSSVELPSEFYVSPESDSLTDSSETDSYDIICIKGGSLPSISDKFGPRGCVCDNEAIYTLPDEDWEPVHEVGEQLEKYLKKAEERLEQSKNQLFEDCGNANRSVDDKMKQHLQMLEDYLKLYQCDMQKLLKVPPKDLTQEKYFSTDQEMRTLLHKITREIKDTGIAMYQLETERIESLKKAFSNCVRTQMTTGNKSFSKIMIEMNDSIKIVNEQLSENMASLTEMMSTAEAHCKATMIKHKSKLDELYMIAQNNDEEQLQLQQSSLKDEISSTREEIASRYDSGDSITKLLSSKSAPMSSAKSILTSTLPSSNETVTGFKLKRALATRLKDVQPFDLDELVSLYK